MKKRSSNRGKRVVYGVLCLLFLSTLYTVYALQRPLPTLKPDLTHKTIEIKPASSSLDWPKTGQSAVGIVGSNYIKTNGQQIPTPIASTAKVITLLTILDKKPLALHQQGPTITLSDYDVALYRTEASQDGSSVPVVAGEQITQYQMMQAIMLPSANNMANSLALWAFGSQQAYTTAATDYLRVHGINNTKIGTDASGLSPTTTSTAQDLVKIGILAMENPVLAEIANQSSATGIPQTTVVKNVNSLLGANNIVGVKTGNTDEAGGVFISASRVMINNKPTTIVTSVAGSPNLYIALKDSLTLVKTAQADFKQISVVKAGEVVGSYRLPWGGTIKAATTKDLLFTHWNATSATATITLKDIASDNTSGANVGTISLPKSATNDNIALPITVTGTAPAPSVSWRLSHPF